MMLKVHLVVGTRPNFIKAAPLYHAMRTLDWARPILVHTGQHFSANMSDTFFEDLHLPTPDHHLAASGSTHARQTAAAMTAYEDLIMEDCPDWVIVIGDVNSTLAACLSAKKLNLPVAHLEAGLRSGDRTMPEEINRIVTDSVSDLLWTPSLDADANLASEGIPSERIDRVGNIMIDAFEMMAPAIQSLDMPGKLGLVPGRYAIATLHRPANVDEPATLGRIVDSLCELSRELDLVFPIHPRTRTSLDRFGLLVRLQSSGVRLLEPLGYLSFMSLVREARFVVTDSGGVQEETTYLGIPCFTLRPNTERPITVFAGTNRLATPETVLSEVREVLTTPTSRPQIEMWDGRAAERVVSSLNRHSRGQ